MDEKSKVIAHEASQAARGAMAAAAEAVAAAQSAALHALERQQEQITRIHDRVFNGFPKELREEVHDEMKSMGEWVQKEITKAGEGTMLSVAAIKKTVDSLNARAWAILVSLMLALAAVVVTGVVGIASATHENTRNLEAIMALDKTLALHMESPTTPAIPPAMPK
jgi:hypothetical protein